MDTTTRPQSARLQQPSYRTLKTLKVTTLEDLEVVRSHSNRR